MRKYKVKQERILSGKVKAHVGDTVYDCKFYDYGLASDDSRQTGMEHISVTKNEDGDYPSFTIPKRWLEEIK